MKLFQLMQQFIKFGLVGFSNTVISYVIYAALVYVGLYYLMSSIIAFVISVLNSFYWNNKYVFKSGDNSPLFSKLIKTFLSYAFSGLILANILLVLWVDFFNVSKYLAPIINLAVTIPLNFVMNKYWAFGDKS